MQVVYRSGAPMPENLVTIATFNTPEEAALARNFLETRGVKAFLIDEDTVGMFWHMGSALGGVKLQVADIDRDRAEQVLDQRGESEPATDVVDDGFAEGRTCPVCGAAFSEDYDYCPECGPPEAGVNEDSETESAITTPEVLASADADDLARRSFRAAIIGALFFWVPPAFGLSGIGILLAVPLYVYAVYLVLCIWTFPGELSRSGIRQLSGALLVLAANFILALLYYFHWFYLFGRY
jgi:hypothetical protein